MAEPTTPPTDPEILTGTPGVPTFGGWVYDEKDPALQGKRLPRTLLQMATTHPLIGVALRVITTTIGDVTWRVAPAKLPGEALPTEEATAAADLLIRAMSGVPWADICEEQAYDVATLGAGWHEVAYTLDASGDWVWSAMELRRGDTIDQVVTSRPDGGGDLLYVVQRTQTTQATIPADRLIRTVAAGSRANPAGVSMLRPIYESWKAQQNLIKIAAIGLERTLAGLPVMELPAEVVAAKTADLAAVKAAYQSLVSQVKVNEAAGIVIPSEYTSAGNRSGFKLSLLSLAGAKGDSPLPMIQFMEGRIAQALLVQFLLLGAGASGGTTGSFALADSHTTMFARAVGALLGRIRDAMQREVGRLMELNGVAREAWPKLEPGDIETRDLAALGAFLDALTKAGVPVTDPATVAQLRETAGLPKVGTDAEEAG
jgi:hypothetical protein